MKLYQPVKSLPTMLPIQMKMTQGVKTKLACDCYEVIDKLEMLIIAVLGSLAKFNLKSFSSN